MTMRLVFDIETDGLIPAMTKIHCVVTRDLDTDEVKKFGPKTIGAGVKHLMKAAELIPHNGINFDIPAIQKIYPDFKPSSLVTDTLVLSRLIYPNLKERDFVHRVQRPDFPGNLIGSHGLKAWGHRLGEHKGDYADIRKAEGKEKGLKGAELDLYVWGTYTKEMMEYCVQDTVVTAKLYRLMMSKQPDPRSVRLEHEVAHIIRRQEEYGFAFDVDAAAGLLGTLSARHSDLRNDLTSAFPAWEVRTPFTPKRDNKTRGYKKGVTVDKVQVVEFNPDSRDHIAKCLIDKYGWKPKVFTAKGKPQVDEQVLAGLTEYPEAKELFEYLMLSKRIGQLSTGAQAWLKSQKEGRIHGRVNTNGAMTGRMTHSNPNVAQVPANGAPWGEECRSLFIASPGMVLVGCDADGLEGRCLAGYINDGGEFRDIILNGSKKDGTDLHSRNASILGCSRDDAKTWFYAFIYGAGAGKLGSILGSNSKRGANSKRQFLEALPALSRLVTGVQRRVKSRGYLTGLDGRRLYIRSEHAALNTLLQSAGAVIMKKALVILDQDLQDTGLVPGVDYEFVANIHDEWQIETKKEHAKNVGEIAADSIRKAGEYFEFGCPLAGSSDIGRNWAETH